MAKISKKNLGKIAGLSVAAAVALTGCPGPHDPTEIPGPVVPDEKIKLSITGTPTHGQTLTANVDTNLEGTKTYSWNGKDATTNQATYTIVEDDWDNVITCTVTIGDESKSASTAAIQGTYANLNVGGDMRIENRTTDKSDAAFKAPNYPYASGDFAAVEIIEAGWNHAKNDSRNPGMALKVANNPVKKIVIIDGDITAYNNGILSVPKRYVFDRGYHDLALGCIEAVIVGEAYAALSFNIRAKSQAIRLADAMQPKMNNLFRASKGVAFQYANAATKRAMSKSV